MATNARKEKLQQRIAALQEKLNGLETKTAPLSRNSEGVPELIEQLNNVIKTHKAETAEVIEILLKAKRTGLSLTKG